MLDMVYAVICLIGSFACWFDILFGDYIEKKCKVKSYFKYRVVTFITVSVLFIAKIVIGIFIPVCFALTVLDIFLLVFFLKHILTYYSYYEVTKNIELMFENITRCIFNTDDDDDTEETAPSEKTEEAAQQEEE